jgi:hypothetical protein
LHHGKLPERAEEKGVHRLRRTFNHPLPPTGQDGLKSLYDAQEREVLELAQRVRTAPAGDPASTESKDKLTSAVYRAFALRQQLNRVELKELEESILEINCDHVYQFD